MNPHNTILKLKGLQEWIAVTEGCGMHLTGEPSKAYVWTEQDAQTIINHWAKRYNTPLQPLPVKQKLNGHAQKRIPANASNR